MLYIFNRILVAVASVGDGHSPGPEKRNLAWQKCDDRVPCSRRSSGHRLGQWGGQKSLKEFRVANRYIYFLSPLIFKDLQRLFHFRSFSFSRRETETFGDISSLRHSWAQSSSPGWSDGRGTGRSLRSTYRSCPGTGNIRLEATRDNSCSS